ncbi:amidohydrolase family protein [Vibrio sp. DW001]|uniref:amidohydrolase family protein n=1 Tax=Vibrio sp. DW001 TaxID=2912315 RepID=UPI0023B031B6|nr:amidohydrolase family protein [Vibrio sp. DW001]WED28810.1 amidohydrolase family protein [Vibrio sp. DW001]
MDSDYLPFHPSPAKPTFRVPEGSVDAHCHVFGPAGTFPYSKKRKYTPCDAPKETLFGLRGFLGFSKNVIVQASCHGTDNSALVDALQTAGDLARGVAVVSESISEEEIQTMHDAGVRAVRFNFVKRLVDSTPRDVFRNIAAKIRPFGWHIVVYFEASDLDDIAPFLIELDTTIVVDHMGRPDVSEGVESKGFNEFIQLMEDNPKIWTKVSCPERLTETPPDYSDVVPFAKKLVKSFPDRVLWGTDWPHPNMRSHVPDDGKLVDVIALIAPTEALQKQLLIDNPNRLYWSK